MIEWLAMDGYGEFIWSAYAIWLVVILANFLLTRRQEKLYRRELTKRLKLKYHQ